MSRLPSDVIGDAYSRRGAMAVLEDLVEVENRMAGQDGEHEGADVVAEAFEDAGLREVSTEEFEIPGWWRGSSALTLTEDDRRYDGSHQVIALPGTPAGDVEADLVDVGHGTPEEFEDVDVEGQIAMASSLTPDDYDRWLHRTEKYRMAIENGAEGFVFRNHVEGCLPPTGGIGEDDGPGAIPAVGVSRELGYRLKRYCEDRDVPARLELDCRNEETTSVNVEGVVGPDTETEVLVTAHHDAHDIAEGAGDNGAGSALVAEIGRILAQVEDDLETKVRCVTFGAEEVGLYGSHHMSETRDLDAIETVINLDGIGYSRNLSISTHGFDVLSETFETVAEELAVPIEVDDGISPHSDHWPFVQKGVPGVMARSTTDESGRGWGHTHADTLDKLDIRDFRDLAVPLAEGVLRLTDADVTPEQVTPDVIEERAAEQGYDI